MAHRRLAAAALPARRQLASSARRCGPATVMAGEDRELPVAAGGKERHDLLDERPARRGRSAAPRAPTRARRARCTGNPAGWTPRIAAKYPCSPGNVNGARGGISAAGGRQDPRASTSRTDRSPACARPRDRSRRRPPRDRSVPPTLATLVAVRTDDCNNAARCASLAVWSVALSAGCATTSYKIPATELQRLAQHAAGAARPARPRRPAAQRGRRRPAVAGRGRDPDRDLPAASTSTARTTAAATTTTAAAAQRRRGRRHHGHGSGTPRRRRPRSGGGSGGDGKAEAIAIARGRGDRARRRGGGRGLALRRLRAAPPDDAGPPVRPRRRLHRAAARVDRSADRDVGRPRDRAPNEGPWQPLERAPLDRAGLHLRDVRRHRHATSPPTAASTNGTATTIQLGVFPDAARRRARLDVLRLARQRRRRDAVRVALHARGPGLPGRRRPAAPRPLRRRRRGVSLGGRHPAAATPARSR